MINVTFNKTSSKAKKSYDMILTEDTVLDCCSEQLQHMILAAVKLESNFTLDELTAKAIELGLTTNQTDTTKIGAWHRPKLISMKVIALHKPTPVEASVTPTEAEADQAIADVLAEET